MNTIDLKTLTIELAQKGMNEGAFTSIDLVSAYLEEIKKVDSDINAYREVFADALEQAATADKVRAELKAAGKSADDIIREKPMLGIPFALKDNICISGRHAGASSKILEAYVAPYDATVVTKLKAAGAVFLGRANMDEFAMGGSTENSAYGVTKNPNDLTRVAGGSSGGSVAAVAMYGALVSLGSDTGGSIRQPASFCGLVGLKPTYGRVSRHGLMAMGSSLDVIGPVTKTVSEAELIFNTIAGSDAYDSTSLRENEVAETAAAHKVASGAAAAKLRVGIVPELMNMGGMSPAVVENLKQSIEKLKAAGVEVKEVSLPHIKYSLAVYYVVMPAEVSSNMARFDGLRYGSRVEGDNLLGDYLNTRGTLLGKEVRRRIMLGTYVLSAGYADAYYNKANIVRSLIAADFKKAFEEVDVVLTLTTPSPAFKIGEKTADPIAMYLEDIFTVTANLIGAPAISIPSGATEVDGKQLPLGVQFTAPHCREDLLFKVGKIFEEVR